MKTFNLADLFELVADQVPSRDALVCGAQRASYGQLEQRANQLAHYLAAQGVEAGSHVGLYLYNCNEYLEAMLACFKLRAVPVNINYRYVQDELAYIFNNAKLVACVHHREFTPHIAEVLDQAPYLATFVAVEDGSKASLGLVGSVEYESKTQERKTWRN